MIAFDPITPTLTRKLRDDCSCLYSSLYDSGPPRFQSSASTRSFVYADADANRKPSETWIACTRATSASFGEVRVGDDGGSKDGMSPSRAEGERAGDEVEGVMVNRAGGINGVSKASTGPIGRGQRTGAYLEARRRSVGRMPGWVMECSGPRGLPRELTR